MPDEPRPVPPAEPEPEAATPQPPIPFDIGEEFGTARKKLPPVKLLVVGVLAIVAVATILGLIQKPHASAIGMIDNITAVEIPDQKSVMVAINVSFQNHGSKPFWIHDIKADLDTGTDQYQDEAAAGSDFNRYFQAFPALKEHALPPLRVEDKVEPEGSSAGTIVVTFPVTMDAFSNRKQIKVTIQPYDQAIPLVLTK